ncbi:hypothetical protein EIK76_07560 [Rheinheimera mesophila]|uniref:Uncharacterized protein n=1 Tax=Rheinheimera mesophila TaxID=1547515 RepID=A0A3P3QT15_9GAMM|nr:hypothetical protein [Rheinheimera mesophila]KKL01054.1 hypothetical protein SD53_11985 [Rheinheimera mesophila]RRJ23898.1 hypothetical protein EIK76_07560 [Rheinheimera mesophila]
MLGNKRKYKITSFILLVLGSAIFLNTVVEIFESDGFSLFEFMKDAAGALGCISIGLAAKKLFLPMSEAFQKVGVSKRHQISDKLIISAGVLAITGLIGSVAL